ncbi:MAG: rhodanese-like domain-containing protein [Gemmatimonadaceae bacterium]
MARTLLENGWKDARALQGGFDAWREAGYPTEPK